jgi:hypothetical protein
MDEINLEDASPDDWALVEEAPEYFKRHKLSHYVQVKYLSE